MSKNKELEKDISIETPIHMTVKILLSIFGGILIIFFGFYQLVIAPQIESHEMKLKDIETKQEERYDNLNRQLMEITNGIGIINGNIEGINNRFNDLRDLRSDNRNTSGSLN